MLIMKQQIGRYFLIDNVTMMTIKENRVNVDTTFYNNKQFMWHEKKQNKRHNLSWLMSLEKLCSGLQLSNVLNRLMWLLFRYNYKLSIIEDVYMFKKNNGVLQ